MEFTRTGIILCTEGYEACVDFYRRILALPELFSLDNAHSTLTCLDMGRIGSADEVAGAVAYLTSDEARYVTGIVLPVCGGRSTIDYLPGDPGRIGVPPERPVET